jgi:hypothetical protein
MNTEDWKNSEYIIKDLFDFYKESGEFKEYDLDGIPNGYCGYRNNEDGGYLIAGKDGCIEVSMSPVVDGDFKSAEVKLLEYYKELCTKK